ncbi:class I SAM-dependent methyltransferase [Novosphingobium sp.]|uniref:class I SAM-dependent methyltransferase n=1 Tax=Novosphingobium sp. TaxID=1874826 RepID=UPI00356B35E0
MRKASLATFALIASLGFSAPAVAQHEGHAMAKAAIDPALAAAVADKSRATDSQRDKYRRPAETLEFFQVAPTMKVGEYAPGGGWYSRLLGLYLGPKGKLVGLFADATKGTEQMQANVAKSVAKFPEEVAGWASMPADKFSALTLGAIPDAEKGTFDRILVMRALHNMMRSNVADSEIRKMRELLKADGMIGIEQHRAKADAPFAFTDGSKGYMLEADIIKLMEIHGFTFVGKSEANANPKDPANWPDGVWTLPPVLGGVKDDAEKARLTAIGESDRMTLLFRKRP